MPDTTYIKELLKEVRDDNKQALSTQASILGTLKGIDDHLERLNSKVATHEKVLNTLKDEHTRFKAVSTTLFAIGGGLWALVTFIFK